MTIELIQGLLLISAVHLLAAASPGPDFVLVTQQTLSNGKRAGLLCSLGISLGLSVHILYSVLGLAVVIANSSTALWIIKILGGSYLIYLGLVCLGAKGLSSKAPLSDVADQPNIDNLASQSAAKYIGMGFLCNALNPKAPIYFVSLFTVFLSPSMPNYQLLIYGVWMMFLQLVWFSLVAIVFSRPALTERFNAASHWIDRVCGGLMLVLGLKVLLTRIN